MSAAKSIREFIANLPDDKIFTTRDLLHLTTSRSAIDLTTHRMVYMGKLQRLARGVFIKNVAGQRVPTIEEVAIIKAQSFGKMIFQHGKNAAAEIGLIHKKFYKRTRYLFYTTGCSSSFRTLQYRVYFKAVSKRKTAISRIESGKLLKAIWEQGKSKIKQTRNKAKYIHGKLNQLEKIAFRKEVRIMPIWMVQMFYPKIRLLKKPCNANYG